ncbi:MAG TPA: O-antigen ligase family protein [Coriobacteriia bacterium]|nr:O-antigen ligase family protein [Coriobacteriia bacterium]
MAKRAQQSAVIAESRNDGGLAVARWSLIALAALLPLATSNFTWLGFAQPFTANQVELVKLLVLQLALAIGVIGWGVHLVGNAPSVRTTPTLWAAFAALVLTVTSSLLAGDVSAAVLGRDPRYMGLITLADFIVVFVLATQALRTRGDKRQVALATGASATLIAAYAMLQHFGVDPVRWGDMGFAATRASGTFGNPIPLGMFLVGSLSLMAALALSEDDSRLCAAEWASLVLQAAALVATFTRGAWLGAVASLAVLAFAVVRQKITVRRIDWLGMAAAAGVVVVLVGLSLGASAETNAAARVSETVNLEAGSTGERVIVMKTALAAIAERPLQGWGPEGFRWAYGRLRPAEAVRLNGPLALADDAHDYPLQLAVTLGVPAALVTLGTLLLVLWLSTPLVFRRRAEQALPIQAGYMAAVGGMLVCLVTGLSSSVSVVLLWLFAGALVPTAPASDERPMLLGRAAALLAAFASIIALVFVAGFIRADALFLRGRTTADLQERIRLYDAASAAAPAADVYAEALGNAYALAARQSIDQARQMESSGQDATALVQIAGDYIAKGVAAFTRATAATPLEAQNYADLARLQLLAGTNVDPAALDAASSASAAAVERSPRAPYALSTQAQVLQAQNRVSEALSVAEKAAGLYLDATTLAVLGQARLANGDKAGAVEALEQAAKYAPGDAEIAAQLAAAKAAK